ncbi:MAG: hypothetical protein O2799_04745 [Planctomycetota bacterium]|nr:hypothetical protein [Planctomycetota bacterium]
MEEPILLASVGAVLRPGDHRLVARWAVGLGCKVLLAGADGAPGLLVSDPSELPEEGDPPLMGISFPRGATGVDAAVDELSRTAVARSLVLLELAGTDASDASAEALLRLVRLVRLDVSDTAIGPGGLEWLRALPELELLRAEGLAGGGRLGDDGREAPLDAALAPAALATRRLLARGGELVSARVLLTLAWPWEAPVGFGPWVQQQAVLDLSAAGAVMALETLSAIAGVRSPGKALLGLEVQRAEGGEALQSRPARVWLRGVAAGIPLLWAVAGARALWTLAMGRRAPWDGACGTVLVAHEIAGLRELLAWAVLLGGLAWLLVG